jgi:hypothetical protein
LKLLFPGRSTSLKVSDAPDPRTFSPVSRPNPLKTSFQLSAVSFQLFPCESQLIAIRKMKLKAES